jgi:FkbM family methyltransferase
MDRHRLGDGYICLGADDEMELIGGAQAVPALKQVLNHDAEAHPGDRESVDYDAQGHTGSTVDDCPIDPVAENMSPNSIDYSRAMPATPMQRRRLALRINVPWRRLMPKRMVHRHVQGVDLYLPWAHLLPDYARMRSWYGQNLVNLAAALERRMDPADPPMNVIDIGANIGDSAAQIMAHTNARLLCVEGDPYWAAYLHKNLDGNPRASFAEVLLTPDDDTWVTSSPVRTQGTTRFTQDADKLGSLPPLSTNALRDLHPDFAQVRLIKSDTDGFDPVLVPAAAQTWHSSTPVLFFEFDTILANATGDNEPNAIWQKLSDLGYSNLAIWDNTGDALGQLPISQATKEAALLDPRPVHLGYHFWDVAACHGDDAAAKSAFDELMPEEFSPLGTWR